MIHWPRTKNDGSETAFFCCRAGVVATSLDSRTTVLKKYPRAETWLAKLDADGAQVSSWRIDGYLCEGIIHRRSKSGCCLVDLACMYALKRRFYLLVLFYYATAKLDANGAQIHKGKGEGAVGL